MVVWTVDEKEESFNMDISKSKGGMLAGWMALTFEDTARMSGALKRCVCGGTSVLEGFITTDPFIDFLYNGNFRKEEKVREAKTSARIWASILSKHFRNVDMQRFGREKYRKLCTVADRSGLSAQPLFSRL